jgi:hypothetical protein
VGIIRLFIPELFRIFNPGVKGGGFVILLQIKNLYPFGSGLKILNSTVNEKGCFPTESSPS